MSPDIFTVNAFIIIFNTIVPKMQYISNSIFLINCLCCKIIKFGVY